MLKKMGKTSGLPKECKNRDYRYFWMRKGFVHPKINESKKRDKYEFSDEDAAIIKEMFIEYELNEEREKRGEKRLDPEECYENVLKRLEIDSKAKSKKKMRNGMEKVWDILKDGKEAKSYSSVLESPYKKKKKRLNSGLDGLELRTKEHVLFFVSEIYPDYEKVIMNIAKTALHNDEFIWWKITNDNRHDIENELKFSRGSYLITNWSELIALLNDKIWAPESLKEDIIDKILKKLIKKKAVPLRILCDEASKMLCYVKNPEGYLSFEGNWQIALSKADLPFTTMCTYRENELKEFMSRDKNLSWDIFKRLIDVHDKIVYFRKKGEIFFDDKAVLRMVEDRFAGIEIKKSSIEQKNNAA